MNIFPRILTRFPKTVAIAAVAPPGGDAKVILRVVKRIDESGRCSLRICGSETNLEAWRELSCHFDNGHDARLGKALYEKLIAQNPSCGVCGKSDGVGCGLDAPAE